MAYPTYGGEGTFVANSVAGAYAVPMPVGLAQNHLIILPTYINKVAAPAITPTYTETGRAGGFTVSTRIAGAAEGDASVTYSTFSAGNVQFGLAIGVSGVDTTTPYEGLVQLAAPGSATSSVASTTITTTGPERLLVYMVATNDDTATTAVTLNGWTDEGTFTTIEGSDAALRLYTLQAATAGSYTTPSFTLAAAEFSDRIGLAVIPASGSGSQTITGALLTNSQTFYGATVSPGAVDIAGALFSNAQTFYSATVAASYTIAGGKFDNAQTFYQATAAPGPVGISGALYTNGQTFYGATVSQASGAQDITAALFTNAQAFFGAVVSVGAVEIAANLFSNDNVFFGATVTDGSAPVQQPITSSGSATTWSRKTASRIAREAERAKSARKARPIIIRAVGAALGGSDDARAAAAEAVSETLTTAPITQDTVAEVYALAERILALMDDEDAEMLLLTAA